MKLPRVVLALVFTLSFFSLASSTHIARAQTADAHVFAGLRWRAIGPFRGGRTKAVTGVRGQPNVFYIGAVNGGVWKTNDFGRTWTPIFDDQPTGSIGAIAVAPSDPSVVYVGSGEGLQRPDLSTGDGIYKSTDAGRTWTHLGIRDGQQIPYILVDPRNANRLFVAVLGHPYGPNAERGVFRSTDGGRTFDKVLYKDENTGASDLDFDPANPDVVYACLWEARQGPWENGAWAGTTGGIFKSTDGGSTWHQLTNGLPPEGIVQADVAVAPSDGHRIYASVATMQSVGIYRSDDAGESWTKITDDPRPAARIGGGDLPVPTVNPRDADDVLMASVVTYRSRDGGRTWTGIRGAPGGDDYQRVWINPDNPDIIAIASDQGAIVTVNGGESWSSWYNQPTSQMYHVGIDNAFPYRVCSGQQESGSACVSSRGNDGEITFREWHPVGAEEYGYATPDPLDADIVYGGKITRYDRRTGQAQPIPPKPIRTADYRVVRTQPIVFSPVDPHVLFFASNTLWKTLNGGRSWQQISPDLTRKTWTVPATVGKYRDQDTAKPIDRGVIYTVAPSPLDANRIWIGTDDGLIQLTTDGGANWKDVTPKPLVAWAKVSIIDAGRFDPQTAYAAINTLRLDDLRPHIYRTHDGGTTWTEIVDGIPDGATVNVVREDPKRKGLLYAGTEREAYVSFDDGGHWESLRLNMPATSIRDLVVKDDDLVVATHGRGFWILDDVTPLRQPDAQTADAVLFKPAVAYRVRWDMNTDTPIPPDEATGSNPPDGAIIDYTLKSPASGPVTLEIRDRAGALVRRYASTDRVEMPTAANAPVPLYWYRPPQVLSGDAGAHRFLWDLHYASAPRVGRGGAFGLPIAAVPHATVPDPIAPWVLPGQYTVTLTVNGRSYTQPLTVKMDPRVRTPRVGLQQQFTLAKEMYDELLAIDQARAGLRSIRDQIKALEPRAGNAAQALATFDRQADALEGRPGGFGAPTPGQGAPTLTAVSSGLATLLGSLEEADVAPAQPLVAACATRRTEAAGVRARWNRLKGAELTALNVALRAANLPAIALR